MSVTFKEFLGRWIGLSRDNYLKDLDALSEEQLSKGPGKARAPYDFTYEVVVVNNRMAETVRGEENGPWPFTDGWAEAPAELKSKEKIKAALNESVDNLLKAIDGASEEELTKKFLPEGRDEETCKANMCNLCSYHMGYHGAQLNYIQSIDGDLDVHWG